MLDKLRNNSTEIILELVEDAKRITKQVMERAPWTGSGAELIDELALCMLIIKKKMQTADSNELYFAIFDVADLLIEANRFLGYSYFQFHYQGMNVSYVWTPRGFPHGLFYTEGDESFPPRLIEGRYRHNQLIAGLRDLYKVLGGELDGDLEPMMVRPHPLDKIGN